MKDAQGFSLIELMIVVAIVGIISMIAVPQYSQYVVRGNRAAAQSFMLDVVNRQKQYLLDARTYAPDLTTLSMAAPPNVAKYYTVTTSVSAGPPLSFTVTATPVSNSSQAADGTLTVNDLGDKGPAGKW